MRAVFLLFLLMLLLFPFGSYTTRQVNHTPAFDGTNAYSYLVQQCDLGPRPPGSDNLTACRHFIVQTLESFGWMVSMQNFTFDNIESANIVANYGTTSNVSVILGAHYDTRPKADRDPNPDNKDSPILGANDGGSGTAALLELSRIIPEDLRSRIELVFFDAEDSGGIDVNDTGVTWSYIMGSSYYVSQMSPSEVESTSAMILLDMIGDEDLRLPRETTSTDSLQNAVWAVAAQLGYGSIFIDESGMGIIDDHSPFLDASIPALDIIHNPFPSSWHTLGDTPDRCSATSLDAVGEVVETFLVSYIGTNATFTPDSPLAFYVTILATSAVVLVLVYVLYYRNRV